MKKIFLLMIVVAGWQCAAQAQGSTITLTKGEEGKKVDVEDVMGAQFLGGNGARSCWLTREDDNKDRWCVYAMDRNQNVLGQLRLGLSREYKTVSMVKGNGVAHVVMVDSSARGRFTVVTFAVDMDSLALVDNRIDTLVNFALKKGDRCYVWGATSDDGERMGVLTLWQMAAKKQYVAEATMFDSEMDTLWNKEYPVGTTGGVAVTNEGELVTFGHEREGNEERLVIGVIGEKSGENYKVTLSGDRLEDMHIVNILGRKLFCAGLFSMKESDPEDDLTGGTAMMVFDLDSAKTSGFSLLPFQNEDMNILLNKKTKKVQKEREVPMVKVLASCGTGWGSVLAVGHAHTLRYMNANGSVTTSYYTQGIHLVAIDGKGEVKWVRNMRRNDMADDDAMLYVGLFAEGDTVCLVKTESPKYPGDYNIAAEAKEYEVGEKSHLVMYRVAENGDVEKTVLEPKTKHVLVGVARDDEGHILLTTTRGSKSRMVEMRF